MQSGTPDHFGSNLLALLMAAAQVAQRAEQDQVRWLRCPAQQLSSALLCVCSQRGLDSLCVCVCVRVAEREWQESGRERDMCVNIIANINHLPSLA